MGIRIHLYYKICGFSSWHIRFQHYHWQKLNGRFILKVCNIFGFLTDKFYFCWRMHCMKLHCCSNCLLTVVVHVVVTHTDVINNVVKHTIVTDPCERPL